jgi:hypothetical protein
VERTLAIRERVLGSDHSETGENLNDLALLLRALGDPAAARPLFERALVHLTWTGHPEASPWPTASRFRTTHALLATAGDHRH